MHITQDWRYKTLAVALFTVCSWVYRSRTIKRGLLDLVKDLLKAHNSCFSLRSSGTLRMSGPSQLSGHLALSGRPVFPLQKVIYGFAKHFGRLTSGRPARLGRPVFPPQNHIYGFPGLSGRPGSGWPARLGRPCVVYRFVACVFPAAGQPITVGHPDICVPPDVRCCPDVRPLLCT